MNKKSLIRRCWKWSWAVTLPVSVVFLVWAVDTWKMYRLLSLKYQLTSNIGLLGHGSVQAGLLLGDVEDLVIPDLRGRDERLDRVHLYIRESSLKKLNSDLPDSGREYVGGSLLYPDGKVYPVDVRYRGDFPNHWSGRKKSLRVKTSKKRLFNGVRQFNLIVPKAPDLLSNYTSYSLAKRMGIMAPEVKLTDVYINGRYSGIYLFVEQLGEQFLRRSSRMPGDLYVGEIVGRDQFPGVGREVFQTPGFWTKAAVNNHNPPEWNEPLKALLSASYAEDPERLMGLIDLDSWARFAAYITICRTTHFDVSHNWRLYFDPAKGRFEPVVWDPVGWNFSVFVPFIDKQSNRMDIITAFVFERLHTDQRFLAAKHAAVEEFFSKGGAEFISGLLDSAGSLEASVSRDRHILIDATSLYTPSEVRAEMYAFKRKVRESVEEVRRAYSAPPEASWSASGGKVRLNVKGFTPVKSLEVEMGPGAASVSGASIEYVKDGKTHSRDITSHVSVHGNTVKVDLPLFSRRVMATPSPDAQVIIRDATVKPASYLLVFKGVKGAPLGVRAAYYGGLSEVLPREAGSGVFPLDGNYGIIPVKDPAGTTTWRGEVVVDGVKEIDGGLVIAAGTRVGFTPGSSLIVRGRLTAEGDAKRPVVFGPAGGATPEKPWGAVVLAGPGADGSVLRHCVFSGGSGLKHGFVEYSAMLSIHAVRGVRIDSCSFSDSTVVDDMVHAVYSELTVTKSRFERSHSDALDLDYAEALIEDSVFTDSGNDALDLMTSRVVVLGSDMERSGDKGISIGEGTTVFVWNTRLADNEIGVQAKDGSKAFVYNTEFSGNKKTVDAYKKNWQYGDGGHVLVFKSALRGSSPALTADKESSLMVYDSFLEGEAAGRKKSIFLDSTVDGESTYGKRARSKESFTEMLKAPERFRPYLKLIDPSVRGRLPHAA